MQSREKMRYHRYIATLQETWYILVTVVSRGHILSHAGLQCFSAFGAHYSSTRSDSNSSVTPVTYSSSCACNTLCFTARR